MSYRTIVADPPWDYGVDHDRWVNGNTSISRPAIPYSPMSLDAIKALQIGDVAAHDCRLFLWTTNRFLRVAFDVAEAWRFRFRQVLVWRKTHGHSPFGGSVAPNGCEFVLVCTLGRPELLGRLPSSVFDAPRQFHSVKPELFTDMVERISPGPYLELFARRQRLGWDTWGNEALQHIGLAGSA